MSDYERTRVFWDRIFGDTVESKDKGYCEYNFSTHLHGVVAILQLYRAHLQFQVVDFVTLLTDLTPVAPTRMLAVDVVDMVLLLVLWLCVRDCCRLSRSHLIVLLAFSLQV